MTDEIFPGYGFPTDPPMSVPLPGDVHALLDESGETIIDITGRMVAEVAGDLAASGEDIESVEGKMIGSVANQLDESERLTGKVIEKMRNSATNSLAESYGIMQQFGFDPPSDDDIAYAKASGDFIGAMTRAAPPQGPGLSPIPPLDDFLFPTKPPLEPIPPAAEPPPDEPGVCDPPVIEPNFGAFGPECPPGYHLQINPNTGLLVCVCEIPTEQPPPEGIGPPGEEPPPSGGPPPTQPPPDDVPPPVPPGPPPIGIDPETCTYPQEPTTQIACGESGPPPKPPSPYWLKVWCEGCGYKWCLYKGDVKPEVGPGESLYGPFASPPNPNQYIKGICKVQVGPKPEDDDEEDETDDEQEEEEDNGLPKPLPKPEPEECVPGAKDNTKCPLPIEEQFPEPDFGADVCKAISDALDGAGISPVKVGQFIGWTGEALETGGVVSAIIDRLIGKTDKPAMTTIFDRMGKWVEKQVKAFVDGTNCDRGKLMPIALALGLMRFINQYFKIIPDQAMREYEYLSNTACQSLLPQGGQADVAFLRGTIDQLKWECYHKANGNHLRDAWDIMDAGRSKLDPSQIDKLYRREKIPKDVYDRLMREAGVIRRDDKQNIHDYNEQFPSQSDTVRLMQRDVADEVNVDWTEADAIFKQKYKGRVKTYFDANGISEETALDYWRAHFHLPSYTMATEMLHRNRPGEVDENAVTQKEDVRQLLIQDDWHPAWIDAMIAISYKPVTRTDAVRAFMIHSIDEEQLHKYFLDWGYTDDSATFYVKYHKRNREIQDTRRAGYPTLRTLSNQYARCEISNREFRDTIAKLVYSEEQEKQAVQAADLSRKTRQRQQAIRSIRRPFVQGIIDEGEASDMLHQLDMDGQCVDEYIKNWSLDRLRRDKRLTAGQLCKMRDHGIITPVEMVIALVRVGWSRDDALRILDECTATLDEKKIRKAEAQARRAAAEAAKRAREIEKLRRLQECGPPSCPTNTPGGTRPTADGPKNPGPGTNGKAPTTPIQ